MSCSECGGEVLAKGLCKRHYSAARRARLTLQPCSVSECFRGQKARGLCEAHYDRLTGRTNVALHEPIRRRYVSASEATCYGCKSIQPRDSFGMDSTKPHALGSYCLQCRRARDHARKGKKGAAQRARRLADIENARKREAEYARRLRAADPQWRARKHGISADALLAMYRKQDNRCAICGEREMYGDKPLNIDHDHSCCPGHTSCGKCVRGLLCGHCNSGLGMFRDDIRRVRRALTYLNTATPRRRHRVTNGRTQQQHKEQ